MTTRAWLALTGCSWLFAACSGVTSLGSGGGGAGGVAMLDASGGAGSGAVDQGGIPPAGGGNGSCGPCGSCAPGMVAAGSPCCSCVPVDPSSVGVGPIDASGQPSALVTTCDGAVSTLSLKLPCLLGGSLTGAGAGQINELECQLSGAPDGSPLDVAINLLVPLGELPMLLNQPVSLPFDGAPPPPPVEGGGSIAGYPGERFSGSLTGTATFSEVDPVGRAFIGRIQQGQVRWSGDRGDSFSCTVIDGPFWAVAGTFI